MRVDDLGSEEADVREILVDLWLDDRRIESLARVIVDEESAVGTKLRAEEAGEITEALAALPTPDPHASAPDGEASGEREAEGPLPADAHDG